MASDDPSTTQVPTNDSSFLSAGYPTVARPASSSCEPNSGFLGPPPGLASTFAAQTECELGAGVPFTLAVKNACNARRKEGAKSKASKCEGFAFNS